MELRNPLHTATLLAALLGIQGLLVSCSDGEVSGASDVQHSTPDAHEITSDDTADPEDSGSGIPVGEPCARPGSCVEGAACVGDSAGARFVCMAECQEVGRICEDQSFCTARLGASPICYTLGATPEGQPCDVNLDCEPGTLCFGAARRGAEQFCIRACHPLDDVCSEDEFCQADDGAGPCRARLGAACQADADCADSLACTATLSGSISTDLTGGYCTQLDCEADARCPHDGACISLPESSPSFCAQPCDQDSDCRFNEGYACVSDARCEDLDDPQACLELVAGRQICLPQALLEAL